MGLLKGIVSLVGLLVLAVVGLGAYLYFTDYEAAGTITEKGRDAEGSYVVIRPKLVPYDIRQPLDSDAARFVCEGYEVRYRIQTQYYEVRDDNGRLVYDSENGARLQALACPAGL
jgi:hypothetical protein